MDLDVASDPLSGRAAALLEPGDSPDADPPHALPRAASANRGLRRVVAWADGPGPQRSGLHDALPAQQGRSGPRLAPSGRRTDSPDRRLDRAQDRRLRYKRILGGRLRARGFEAQQREAIVGCTVLNKMLALGKAQSSTLTV